MVESVYEIDVVAPAAELKAAIARVISLSRNPDTEFTTYLSKIHVRQFTEEPDWSLNLAIALGKWVRAGKTKHASKFIRTANRSKAEKQPTTQPQVQEPQEHPEPEEQ